MNTLVSYLTILGFSLVAGLLVACGSNATPTPSLGVCEVSPSIGTPEPPGGSATVEFGSATLAPGELTRIPITVKNITDPDGLGAYHFCFTLDPSVVEAVAVYGGDSPFGSVDVEGQEGALPIYRINNQDGWVTLISFQANQIPGPIEDIVVAYVEMKAVGTAGKSSTLDLVVKSLPSAEGVKMASTVINGTVVIR